MQTHTGRGRALVRHVDRLLGHAVLHQQLLQWHEADLVDLDALQLDGLLFHLTVRCILILALLR